MKLVPPLMACALLSVPAFAQDPDIIKLAGECWQSSKHAIVECPPDLAEDEHHMRLDVQAGVLVSLSSDGESKAHPLGRISVDAALADGDMAPRLDVQADLTALPGESFSFQDVSTFRAIQFRAGIRQRIHPKVFPSVYAEFGFASRLDTSGEVPRDRAPLWASFGIDFRDKDSNNWLRVGMGPDERLGSGDWQVALHVQGKASLWQATQQISVNLIGEATLGLQDFGGGRADRIVVGISVGL